MITDYFGKDMYNDLWQTVAQVKNKYSLTDPLKLYMVSDVEPMTGKCS